MNTQYLQHQNGTLAYDDTGRGPLVICVPGMGDLRGEYRFLIPQLVAAGYRAVSLDVRGHGESSTDWSDFSVAGIGSDILALIRHLNAGPAIVIGTSMAAGAGVWAAAEAPELISGLVLIGPFVRGDGDKFLQLMFAVMFARPWGPSMWLKYFSTLYPTRKPADFAEYAAALHSQPESAGTHGSAASDAQCVEVGFRTATAARHGAGQGVDGQQRSGLQRSRKRSQVGGE